MNILTKMGSLKFFAFLSLPTYIQNVEIIDEIENPDKAKKQDVFDYIGIWLR